LIAIHFVAWEGATQTEEWYVVVMKTRQRAGNYHEISQDEGDAAEQQGGKCGDGHMH
jgi:hypothetical protein